MRGVQQVFSVSLKVLTLLGLVFSVALYGSAQWLIDSHIITDPRALLAIQLLSPAIFIVTILSCFRGYFKASNTWFLLELAKYLNKSSAYPLWWA